MVARRAGSSEWFLDLDFRLLFATHGRLDVSGPLIAPWWLHRRWPGSRLVVIEDEDLWRGHVNAELQAAYAWIAEG